MQRVQLGASGPTVSELCLGTGGYGTSIVAEQAWSIMDRFLELGGTFLDTAHVYGAWEPGRGGASERVIGDWLCERGCRRDVVLGTKGGHPALTEMEISRLRPGDIATDLHESLERLRSDDIDIYWLHRDDPSIPVGEIVDALNEHLAAGLVHSIGCSNWTTDRLAAANRWAAANGKVGFCASQIGYSLARANTGSGGYAGMLYVDEETHASHRRTEIPVVAYSSQAGGFFSGKYAADDDPASVRNRGVVLNYYSAENFQRLERAQELAAAHGRTANEVNLAYLRSQPFQVVPIVGSRSAAQVEASCAACGWRLTEETCRWLESGDGSAGGGDEALS